MNRTFITSALALAVMASTVAPSQAFNLKSFFPGKGELKQEKVDGSNGHRRLSPQEIREGKPAYDGKLSFGGRQPLHVEHGDREGGYIIWI
ncbi:MAG: hypothetical protein AAGL24_25280 [Pseudomonadota bacterium]